MGYQNVMSLAYVSKVAVGRLVKTNSDDFLGHPAIQELRHLRSPGGQSTPKLRRHSTIIKPWFLKGSTNFDT